MAELRFKEFEKGDGGELLRLITKMAEYEKMADQLVATEEALVYWILEEKKLEMLLLQEDGKNIGYICFFSNFSTYLCRPGIFLEDVFILPEHRGKGYGRTALEKLARIAVERGYGRYEWMCLKWNEPSIRFYEKLGARQLDEWTMFRMEGKTLRELGERNAQNAAEEI